MADCGCKSNKNIDSYLSDGKKSDKKLVPTIGMYALKSIGFILMLAALPIINLFIIWFIFRTLILNKDVDIKPLLLAIGKKFKQIDGDEDDSDYDSLTEEDVVMVDVEDITNKSK